MKKVFLTFILGMMMTLTLSAQGGITEPGATEPNSLYTTTYDNPITPNHAPGGPNKVNGYPDMPDPGNPADGSPIGTPWVLLGFAAVYAVVRLVRRKSVEE